MAQDEPNHPQHQPPPPAGFVVTGPNHALHAILTLFTFWMCGGWAWIWLIIALSNKRQVTPVDAYGRPIAPPPQPYQPSPVLESIIQGFNTAARSTRDYLTTRDKDWWTTAGYAFAAVAILAVAVMVTIVVTTS